VTVASNNDGLTDSGAFAVCNSTVNNVFITNAVDLNNLTPGSLVKVIRQYWRTNVDFLYGDRTLPISDYSTASNFNVSLVIPTQQGSLRIRCRAFYDVNNNNILDVNEQAGDWIDYSVTVKTSTDAISFTAGAITICSNAVNETYTATTVNGASIVYSAFPASAGVINATTGVMVWNTAFFGTATITATSNGPCGMISTDRVVTVNKLPVVSAGTYGPVDINGADITLVGSPAGGIWSGTGVIGTGPYVFDPSVGTQTLNYTFTNANSCTASASTTITVTSAQQTPRLQMTINGVTVASNNDGLTDSGAFAVCNSTVNNVFITNAVDLNNLTPGSLVKVIRQYWRTNVDFLYGDRTLPISDYSTASNFNVSLVIPMQQGSLRIRCRAFYDVNNNNILDVNEQAGDWIDYNVTVNTPAVQPGNFTALSSMVIQGQSDVSYVVPNVAGVTYLWSYLGTGATIAGTTNSVLVSYSATATSGMMSVTASNSCGTSISRSIDITVNGSTLKSGSLSTPLNTDAPVIPTIDLKVYPNPSSGPVTFEFRINDNAKTTLDIFGVSGKRIARIFDANVESSVIQTVHFDESLPSGIYVYVLKWNDQVITGKLIRNK